jgi:predicted MPP superfamily phosphohydrolase
MRCQKTESRLRKRLLSVTLAVMAGVSLACSGCQSAPVEPIVLTKGETPASKIGATFPNHKDSLKFAVLGDFGSGSVGQYQTAARMAETHSTFPYEIVLTVGDNLYGSQRRQDFVTKFEVPYKLLLDAKVKFYAALGNHDIRDQRNYEHFNMGGKLYYSFKAPRQDVKFFVLETTYPDPEQIKWLEEELKTSTEDWKIAYFHHPLYSSGSRHGSDEQLRESLEPLFVKYGVSVVFTGHDHLYERTKPQQGITYFVAGSGGMLRAGGFRPNQPFSEKVNASTMVFLVAEILDDKMYFKAISREGTLIDEGELTRRENPSAVGLKELIK